MNDFPLWSPFFFLSFDFSFEEEGCQIQWDRWIKQKIYHDQHRGKDKQFLRPVQTLATTRNIVGANNVVSCCAMLADVCKRSQQVTACWVFKWEYKGLWATKYPQFHTYYSLVRVRRRNIVGCAVQTNATYIVESRTDDRETTEMLALVGYEVWPVSNFIHWTTSNKSQQRTTWCVTGRPQHVGSKNVASYRPTMLRAFFCTGL